MCGIAGLLGPPDAAAALTAAATHMSAALAHRGPDAAGTWVDEAAGVALGHRRLAIVDLTPTGAQPMASASGRLVVTFNGELYNFLALREQLAGLGHAFRGRSDTEVLLAALEQWGLPGTLPRLVGMFAFACWDRESQALWLARDRSGEKPLYYGRAGATLLFGSELKALRAHPAFQGGVDREALAAFLQRSHVPSPRTIHPGVHKLPPGTSLVVRHGEPLGEPTPYWSPVEAAREARAQPWSGTDEEATDAVEALLREVVAGQMLADVPLGAFLSGGIDSSLLVALMQALSPVPVKTFTIGFAEGAYDESAHARAVAGHLGTDHTAWIVRPSDTLAVIPELPRLYDEPFADSSQLPTHLVATLARRQVKVALSGDGGDEVFGGYNRHVWGPRVWRQLAPVPPWLRATAARLTLAVPPSAWDGLAAGLSALWPRLAVRLPGDKVHKAARLLAATGPEDLYDRLLTHWPQAYRLVPGAGAWPERHPPAGVEAFSVADQFLLRDHATYLPDDILVKVDRATMAVSLESRAPYLDHRLFELAWRLPPHLRIQGREGKVVLRRLLARHLPPALFERPKMGFGVPIGAWLRGPLREWAEDLLAPDRLASDGLLDPAPIRARWAAHLAGRLNAEHELWNVLMFQAWHAHQRAARTPGGAPPD
ncbi:MAG: asparagine synthase (glutamine-hydrolyzing) [Candidatus Sericytochromatia bacterium]|nr:asparagine synthase (glutamine-hydrolyzing) [Candidatus Sericytochromatia bacterium]